VNPLLAVSLLCLVAWGWFALSRRGRWRSAAGISEALAFASILAAAFFADVTIEVRYFLTTDATVFEIDAGARASLVLFGGLWLVAGLLNRQRESGPAGIPLLLALSGAIIVALAKQGPAIFCGMLVAGFGLCAVVASELGANTRQPARIMAMLLVASYLLLFEVLLHVQADPAAGMLPAVAGTTILAVALLAGVPPAHVWQTVALPRTTSSTSLLLAGVPAGVALTGGQKLLSGAGSELGLACVVLAVAGAAWSARAGLAQRCALATVAYAVAATASLLLIGLAAEPVATAWITASLLASCSALVVLRLLRPGFARTAAMAFVVLLHGIAGGQLAVLAANSAPGITILPASLAAVAATMLVTLAARRIALFPAPCVGTHPVLLSHLLPGLAAVGLIVAWTAGADSLNAVWPAAAGVSLGLYLARSRWTPRAPVILEAYRNQVADTSLMIASRALEVFCEGLPRIRDRLQRYLLSLWQGRTWASRIASLESLLAVWPVTALGVIFLAIAIGLLLIG